MELKTKLACPCISGRSCEGLLNVSPTSLLIFEIFTLPSAVNCGVLGNLRKLKTLLPPSVCALVEMKERLKKKKQIVGSMHCCRRFIGGNLRN